MLDLGKLQHKCYEIKLVDGRILEIPKPNQLLLSRMLELEKIKDYNKALNIIYSLIFEMFNTNKNNIKFSLDDIKKMFDLEIALIVIQDYMEFSFKILGE